MDRPTLKLIGDVARRRNIERRVCTPDIPMPPDHDPEHYLHTETFDNHGVSTCSGCGNEVRGSFRIYNGPELAEAG